MFAGTENPPGIELKPDQRFYCTWPWETVVLMSDGTIVCGCADPFKQRPAGNAAKSSIRDIWTGPVFRQIREGLHRNDPVLCAHCNLMQVADKNVSLPPETSPGHLPHRLFVEPCISCNLSCYEACCNHENGIHKTRSIRLLDWNTYTKVIDELGTGLQRIDFFNYGESFIHPRAIEMIHYAKSRHPQIYLFASTNGLLLNTDEKLRSLVASGIDELTFSIDGATQDTYVRYRRGGDFNKLMKIMERLVQIKNEMKSDTPFVNWRYILFRWNDSDEEMDLARRMATELGIDRLCWEITDHPENSASERFVPGTADYERIKSEIWSTLGNAISRKALRARIEPKGWIWHSRPGKIFQAAAGVQNAGGTEWKNTSLTNRRHITFGIQLCNSEKSLINQNFGRNILPRNLQPGEAVAVDFQVTAPEKPGQYWLKMDMVCEGMEWFESGGNQPVFKRFVVL